MLKPIRKESSEVERTGLGWDSWSVERRRESKGSEREGFGSTMKDVQSDSRFARNCGDCLELERWDRRD